jgi:hypothetical protein
LYEALPDGWAVFACVVPEKVRHRDEPIAVRSIPLDDRRQRGAWAGPACISTIEPFVPSSTRAAMVEAGTPVQSRVP